MPCWPLWPKSGRSLPDGAWLHPAARYRRLSGGGGGAGAIVHSLQAGGGAGLSRCRCPDRAGGAGPRWQCRTDSAIRRVRYRAAAVRDRSGIAAVAAVGSSARYLRPWVGAGYAVRAGAHGAAARPHQFHVGGSAGRRPAARPVLHCTGDAVAQRAPDGCDALWRTQLCHAVVPGSGHRADAHHRRRPQPSAARRSGVGLADRADDGGRAGLSRAGRPLCPAAPVPHHRIAGRPRSLRGRRPALRDGKRVADGQPGAFDGVGRVRCRCHVGQIPLSPRSGGRHRAVSRPDARPFLHRHRHEP